MFTLSGRTIDQISPPRENSEPEGNKGKLTEVPLKSNERSATMKSPSAADLRGDIITGVGHQYLSKPQETTLGHHRPIVSIKKDPGDVQLRLASEFNLWPTIMVMMWMEHQRRNLCKQKERTMGGCWTE